MMFFSSTFAIFATVASVVLAQECTEQRRIESSNQVAIAYNTRGLRNTIDAFDLVPWGSPDSAGPCLVTIIPNGLGCGIPVATTGAGTTSFASTQSSAFSVSAKTYSITVATRQVFNDLEVTEIVPFSNGTVLLSVEIRLGVREFVPLPVTFHGYVYMDYNSDCRIYAARAYADIPTSVLGFITAQAISIPSPGLFPICSRLPIGGQKKREIEFEA